MDNGKTETSKREQKLWFYRIVVTGAAVCAGVVFFEVILENIGNVRISAQPRRYEDGGKLLPAYLHTPYEALDFSVSLMVRPLPQTGYSQSGTVDLGKQEKVLDWFGQFNVNLK